MQQQQLLQLLQQGSRVRGEVMGMGVRERAGCKCLQRPLQHILALLPLLLLLLLLM
jgi:hypothetical protein